MLSITLHGLLVLYAKFWRLRANLSLFCQRRRVRIERKALKAIVDIWLSQLKVRCYEIPSIDTGHRK
jgi:hypothetical protein